MFDSVLDIKFEDLSLTSYHMMQLQHCGGACSSNCNCNCNCNCSGGNCNCNCNCKC